MSSIPYVSSPAPVVPISAPPATAERQVVGSAMDDTHRNPNKIFVGGLGQGTTTYSLKSYFSQFGKVLDAAVVTDKLSGRSRGFGFCSFTNEESVERCVSAKHRIDGVTVEIRRAVPRDEARGNAPYDTVELQGKIFIGGLPEDTTEENLKEHFERFGPVKEATLMYDKNNHRPRGFGFVIFSNRDDADKAVGEHVLNGRTVESKKATPRPQHDTRGRPYGRGERFDRFGAAYGLGAYGRGGYDSYVQAGYYDPYPYGGGYGSPAGYGAPAYGSPGAYGAYGPAGGYGAAAYAAPQAAYGAPQAAYGGGAYGAVASPYGHSAVGGQAGVPSAQDYYGAMAPGGTNGQVAASYGQAAYGAAAGGSYGDYATGGPQRATRYAGTGNILSADLAGLEPATSVFLVSRGEYTLCEKQELFVRN